MTLVFDQPQAAAVYIATQNAKEPSFVSPFIGRWDDRGHNGLDLVKNIIKMYKKFDKQNKNKNHVLVLAASIRNLTHLYGSIFLGADILTLPLKVIEEWVADEQWIPDSSYRIKQTGLKSLVYQDLPLKTNPLDYFIKQVQASLLDEGLKKFVADWQSLLNSS